MSTSKFGILFEARVMRGESRRMIAKEQFVEIDDGLLVRAPAKINLSLLIAGKRPDGFHEIETIMAKINFYDELLIQKAQEPGIEVISKGPQWSPQGKDNLVYTAAEMLFDHCRLQTDIKITLNKNIPAGSGLGSASSDAAAALMGLNKYLNLKLPDAELAQLGAQLGADVVFFLDGPLAFCTGKGEKIKKISKIFNFLALLILPDVNVSTKTVYNDYNHNIDCYKKLNMQINALLRENDIDLVTKMCANMLQSTCFALYKGLEGLKAKIESLGVGPLNLSGSGSAMFWIVGGAEDEKATEYQHKIKQMVGCNSIIVSNNRW